MIGGTKLRDRGVTTTIPQIIFRPGIRALVCAALVVDPLMAIAAAGIRHNCIFGKAFVV